MARPKLRLDLSTTEDKENVVAIKDVKRKIVPDGARDLQTLQAQVANVLGTESELSQTPPPSTVKQSRSAELPRETAEGLLTPDLTASIAELTICSSADSISSAPTLIVQPSKDLLTDFHLPKVSANDPKAQICFDFTKGVCTRGGSCKFSHDVALIVSVNSQERGICFDFLRGQCHRGLLCRFSHDLSSLAAQQCQRGNRRNAPICYDFVKGVCARGPDCRYSHDINSIINDTRHTSQHTHNAQLCHDYSKGRCARGAACRYSHDFSALTANPSLPALTAAAAAAAIAQMSIHSGGLLPHLALLQSHIPPAPQPIPLQQQLMFEHRNPTPPAPQPSIFNKAAFLQQASRNFRDFVPGQHVPFNMANLNTIPSFPGTEISASPRQHDVHHHAHSSLLSQKLQEHRMAQQLGLGGHERFNRGSSPPALHPQKSMPHLYGAPGEQSGGLAAVRPGSSLDSAQGSHAPRDARQFNIAADSPLFRSYLQAPPTQPVSSTEAAPLKVTARSFEPRQAPPSRPPFVSLSSVIQPPSTTALPPLVVGKAAYGEHPSSLHPHASSQNGRSRLMADAPEYRTVDQLRYNSSAAVGSATAREDSAHNVESDSRSSTSENSSIHAFEASDASLQSAGSGHLFMCQEIWKR